MVSSMDQVVQKINCYGDEEIMHIKLYINKKYKIWYNRYINI